MHIRIIRDKITREELRQIAEEGFGDLVKAVVDVRLAIMAIGGELHADAEAMLLEEGSRQEDLWGINLYPGVKGEGWPSRGNRSRHVEDAATRGAIVRIAASLVG